MEVRLIRVGAETHAIVHLIVDTQDAMGANLINTMCEGVAPLIERITGGRVRLRILSNLADLRLARASCRIPFEALADFGFSGAEVAHGPTDSSVTVGFGFRVLLRAGRRTVCWRARRRSSWSARLRRSAR